MHYITVPDVVEECGAVPVYNEVILERININWKALTVSFKQSLLEEY